MERLSARQTHGDLLLFILSFRGVRPMTPTIMASGGALHSELELGRSAMHDLSVCLSVCLSTCVASFCEIY